VFRERKLLERLIHNPCLKLARDKAIIARIKKLREYRTAKVIAFYMPVHGEISLLPLFPGNRTKKIFLLPKISGPHTLKFYPLKNLNLLKLGKFKIPEPPAETLPFDRKKIDIFLVPGLAFDAGGNRLGYGRGYYDYFLKDTPGLKIGIAYDFQLVENIPAGKTDVPMDMIITEKKTIRP